MIRKDLSAGDASEETFLDRTVVSSLKMFLSGSFCWLIAVDLTPAAQRPYIGSSGYNSEISLTFGYNGLVRIFGFSGIQSSFSLIPTQGTGLVMTNEIGDPDPLCLLNQQLGSR